MGHRLFWPLVVLSAVLLASAPVLGGESPADYAAAVLGYFAGVAVCWATWPRR